MRCPPAAMTRGALTLAALTRVDASRAALLVAPLVATLWLCLPANAVAQAAPPNAELPPPWRHVPINDRKPPTRYTVENGPEGQVIHALADRSASLLMQPADPDLADSPRLRWRWRIGAHPEGADNAVADREDAAARLVLVFDGDRARLPLVDRMVMATADRLSGQRMPYAILMYVAAPSTPLDTVVANPYTRRIQMLVADVPLAGTGAGWHTMERDVRADFQRAFGEPPGRLLAWGWMSDCDNTASRCEARFGALQAVPRP